MLWLFQGGLPMKLLVILFSAFFVTALFDVGLAVSQTARPSQAVSAADEQALDECQARYPGGACSGRFAARPLAPPRNMLQGKDGHVSLPNQREVQPRVALPPLPQPPLLPENEPPIDHRNSTILSCNPQDGAALWSTSRGGGVATA